METSYRTLLKQKLAERCTKNPKYSLRAFALNIGISASQISKVINEKHHLSLQSARVVAEALFENEVERDLFVGLVDFETARSGSARTQALKKIDKLEGCSGVQSLQVEAFRVISEWYHIPLMNLLYLKDVEHTPKALAALLGITQIECKLALERLEALELIRNEGSRYVKVHQLQKVRSPVPRESIRSFHRQMITKALDAIDGQEMNNRTLQADTIAINQKDLPKVRQLMEKFSRELRELVVCSEDADCVYQVNMQLFNLLKKGHTK